MTSEWKASEWKAKFDLTMERIFKDIAENRRILDEARAMRDEPRSRHLHLVPPIEDDNDG
jgi:hypothetical protein